MLTTCQALRYALIPGLSEDFEKIAYDQRPFADVQKNLRIEIYTISPLYRARSFLLIGITTLALGIIGMIVTRYHPAFVSMTMGGVLTIVGGACMLYDATAKIQTAWNNKLSI